MKKRLPKLTLHFESLRLLDGPSVTGAYATDAATCPLSCAPTCGASGVAARAPRAAFTANRQCCV
jgi:hypothetical protein